MSAFSAWLSGQDRQAGTIENGEVLGVGTGSRAVPGVAKSPEFSPFPKLCFTAALRGELNETEPGIWSGPFEKPSTFSSELAADIQTAFVLGLRLFLM